MAGETKQLQLGKTLHPVLQDDGTSLDRQSSPNDSSEHFSTTDTDDKVSSKGPKVDKAKKERKGSQREAVIRPQQAGKIDFRSLQNKTKFSTDRTWSSGKASPQSPSGKGRNREKSKRCGKSERDNPQPLYNLSITNPRSNLNIGIAYPQQKVSPAKKLDTSVPVSGSYRFHVPSVPEREVEIQQEELSHRFQDNSSHLTSQSFTSLSSSSGISSHQHLSQQQSATMEPNTGQSGGQLMVPEFQMSSSNVWQSPERTFNGANYGVPSQKCAALKENKGGTFTPFHYGYNFLEESTSDSFSCEQNSHARDLVDTAGSVHVSHGSYSFMSRDGPNMGQNNTQFGAEQQAEHRSSYHHSSQLQRVQGGAASVQCTRNLTEDSASSDSSGSSSQQLEQGKNSLPENTDATGCADAEDAAITSGNKRNSQPKDTNAAQRTLLQGGVHRSRNASGSQINFPNNIHPPSVAFEKCVRKEVVNRHSQSWSNKTYSATESSTTHYHDVNDTFKFQNQPALDKRSSSSKGSRLSWQQSTVPTQNRIEMSRQINNQKWSFMVSPSDVSDDSKTQKHKISGSFQNGRSAEGFSNQRQETVRQSNATFKIEMSHTQLCESKNKVYFGINQSVPGAATRCFTYPPLQAPPMGLMMVSPYESPSPSPGHNQASSSTCSSLSPASTSPVNVSADESQMSKAALPNLFYQQTQTKAQLSTGNLSSHQFHADPPRNLPAERTKDDVMTYMQNNNHSKSAVNKGYLDSFGIDHQQPPPPYAAHQLFANLDQLDVLLTCKQCDQNFNNLTSFLGHKQYCSQNAFAQNDLKDLSKMEDGRKIPAEPAKQSPVSNVSATRCSPDLHLSLLGLNKNGELMTESETKADKDDSMKMNLFPVPANAPAALPELELEDAKLDRLITEALNGLGYQSDNPEIDSSFIDAFGDDELTAVKGPTNKQSLKSKELQQSESKAKHEADSLITQGKCFYDADVDSPKTNKDYTESKLEDATLNLERKEKINIKKGVSHKNSTASPEGKTTEQEVRGTRKLGRSEDENTSAPRFLLSSKFSQRCGVRSTEENSGHATHSHTSPKPAVKESKKKGSGGGTWSKEMIHKIVQQKNKIQKVQVKGTKNLQFSLVMERLTPPVTNSALGEYDYVSNSDDDCEPVKIPSQNRINQSSRCKYTYTKECKWRARNDRDQAAWRHESKECFEVKRSEEVSLSPDKPGANQRLKRRGSRSSTSSDLSASVSVSSDGINSPKSVDPLDSDCEKKSHMKKRNQKTYERSSPQKLLKESGTLALMFTKAVKKCDSDKPPLVLSNREESENTKAVDPLSSSLKDTNQKSKSSKSKEKLVAGGKDTLMSCRDTSERQNKLKEQTQIDSHPRQFDFSNIDKSTDLNVEENTRAGIREKPHTPELELSFEKQSDSVFVGKQTEALVGGLDSHKPFCGTLMNETCLSPADGSLIQKDPLHLMPYPLDQEQGIMKSPLSFDTAAMYGEFAPFDTGLFSEMPLPKDNFHSMQNIPEKKEEYASSLSSFLEHRDWNLIVSPDLPVEISQYKENPDKSNEKKADFNHVPLTVPEKIIDYSVNLNTCPSEDELEIKRIVNELENQLQSTKLEKQPLLCEADPKHMQMSKFSPLCLDEESQSDSSDLSSSVTTLQSESFTEQGISWSSPFQFELMTDHSSSRSTVHEDSLEHLTKKDSALPSPNPQSDTSPLLSEHKETNPQSDSPTERKDDAFEQQQYTENLMKSLEVISDSVFNNESAKTNPQETMRQNSTETDCTTEAITQNENELSSSNINEEQEDVRFVLNSSSLSLSDASKQSVDEEQLKCGPEEEVEVLSDSDMVQSSTDLSEGSGRNLKENVSQLLENDHHPKQ